MTAIEVTEEQKADEAWEDDFWHGPVLRAALHVVTAAREWYELDTEPCTARDGKGSWGPTRVEVLAARAEVGRLLAALDERHAE